MANSCSPFAILDQQRVFQIGIFARRITIHDQQKRASSLIVALFEEKKLRKGSRVAVIGAGFSGLTAAVCAAVKSCKVVLFEQDENPLSIQSGAMHRWIHPNIFDWPSGNWKSDATMLPFLNWQAGSANEVVRTVRNKFILYRDQFDIQERFFEKVESFHECDNSVIVRTTSGEEEFDIIILAVGFGLEGAFWGHPVSSYWSVDPLHQGDKSAANKLHYLISGTGDSGLIDTMRICFSDFSHEKLQNFFLHWDTENLQEKLLDFEEIGKRDEKFNFLKSHQSLELPEKVKKEILNGLRKNIQVTLIGASFNTSSMILNRYLVSILIKIGAVEFIPGRIKQVERQSDQKINVKLSDDTNICCDRMVIRHGPQPAIASFNIGPTEPKKSSYLSNFPEGFYSVGWNDRKSLVVHSHDGDPETPIDEFINKRFSEIAHSIEISEQLAIDLRRSLYEIVLNAIQPDKGGAKVCCIDCSDGFIRVLDNGKKFNQFEKAKESYLDSTRGLGLVGEIIHENKKINFSYKTLGKLNLHKIDLTNLSQINKCKIEVANEHFPLSRIVNKYDFVFPDEDCDMYLFDMPNDAKRSKSRGYVFKLLEDHRFADSNTKLILRFSKGDREKKNWKKIVESNSQIVVAEIDRDN